MARSKKGKGSGKNTPKHGQSAAHASSPKTFARPSDDAGSSNQTPGMRTFTMRDAAARASDNHSRPWTWEPNLRHKSMNFVKSGQSNDAATKLTAEREAHTSSTDKNHRGQGGERSSASALPANASELQAQQRSSQQAQPAAARAPSPTPSNSSEEVIVFTGRKPTNGVEHAAPTEPLERPSWDDTPGTWVHHGERIKKQHDDKVFGKPSATVRPQPQHPQDRAPTALRPDPLSQVRVAAPTHTVDDGQISSLMHQTTLGNASPSHVEASQSHVQANVPVFNPINAAKSKRSAQDEMLQDYVENMRASGMLEHIKRAQHATDDESIAKLLLSKEVGGWAKSDLEDLADLSTSDEVQSKISQVLSKRDRTGAIQYLVVWEGDSPDEAKWIRRPDLVMDGAQEMIDAFEAEERQIAHYQKNAGEDSDEEESAADDDVGAKSNRRGEDTDTDNEWEDETEGNFEPSLSDEQIARLLAKQEELGMGSDQLLILDDDFEDPLDDDEHGGLQGDTSRPRRSRRERKRKWRVDNAESEDDELFGADQAQSLDPMDWERPSLHAKRPQAPAFGVSDSELETNLQSAWSKDRQKKKAIKQEREELRAQGLLGSGKNNQAQNMSAKYRNGFSLEQFRNELADFLDDDGRRDLELPPLDKRERKLVHEFANVFNCKSKSNGSGRNRYPVIYKTRRSIDFEDRLFDRIERRMGRQGFGGSVGKSKAVRPGRATGGGRGSAPGLRYREGEKVGAGASEIGAENRGRAMLEKMGWSKGTALGAVDNKGILLPIEHIVKTSRAGLG